MKTQHLTERQLKRTKELNNIILSNNITALRTSLGYTQEHFCEILGMTLHTYQKMEEFKCVSLNSLCKISAVTGVEICDLFLPEFDPKISLPKTNPKKKSNQRFFVYLSKICESDSSVFDELTGIKMISEICRRVEKQNRNKK